jgi:hypothetical protein
MKYSCRDYHRASYLVKAQEIVHDSGGTKPLVRLIVNIMQISGKYLTTPGYKALNLQTLQRNHRHECARKNNVSNPKRVVMPFSEITLGSPYLYSVGRGLWKSEEIPAWQSLF